LITKPESRYYYGYVIVAICFLYFALIMGLTTSFGVYFSPLIEDMGWSRTATSGAFSLNGIVLGVFGIAGGWLNDKLGPRKVLPLLGIISAVGYFLVSQMTAIWQFYLFFGFFVAMGINVYVPCMSTIARWFVQKRSLMSGIALSGSGIGMIVLPLLINWCISLYNWRVSIVILSAAMLIISVLAMIFIRNSPEEKGLRPYGSEITSEVKVQRETESVTVNQALRSKSFWLFFLSLACYGFCFVAFQVHIAVHATDTGISSTGAASVLTAMGVAMVIGQLIMSPLGDKFGSKRMYIVGLCCIVPSILVIIFARELWGFYIFALLLGLAFGNCSTQESPLAAWLFGLGSHGTLLGIFAFSFTIGSATGPLVFGAIYDNFGSYQYAFWLAFAVSILALFFALFLRRTVAKKA